MDVKKKPHHCKKYEMNHGKKGNDYEKLLKSKYMLKIIDCLDKFNLCQAMSSDDKDIYH